MLSRPKSGWTDFSLGMKEYGLSYLTNIPVEWLDQAIHGLETLEPFAVHGVLEPGRMICVVSYWNCHIIVEEEERVKLEAEDVAYEICNVDMLHFCKMLYRDILDDIEEWCCWDCDESTDTEIVKKDINKKLEKLSELISERTDYFGLNRGFF